MAPEETVLENGPEATRPIHLTVNGKGCALDVGEGHGRVSPSHTPGPHPPGDPGPHGHQGVLRPRRLRVLHRAAWTASPSSPV